MPHSSRLRRSMGFQEDSRPWRLAFLGDVSPFEAQMIERLLGSNSSLGSGAVCFGLVRRAVIQ